MSRYHPVRPKKNVGAQRAAPSAPPAAPPMPTQAQMETVARERLEMAFEELYKLCHGDTVDAAIARSNRLLAMHEREEAKVTAAGKEGQYRWSVSPAIMMRLQREVERLEARQDYLRQECWKQAQEIVARLISNDGPITESLCQPKQTEPATRADSVPPAEPAANPTEGGAAAVPPIAA